MSQTFENTIAEMKDKLDRISRNKEKIALILIREGWINEADYTKEQLDAFAESLCIVEMAFNTDADGVSCDFTVTDEKDMLGGMVSISMLPDNSIELKGTNEPYDWVSSIGR